MHELKIKEIVTVDDRTGKFLITYSPVFTARLTAWGSIQFPCWQVWEDDSEEEKQRARSAALNNARKTLGDFSFV